MKRSPVLFTCILLIALTVLLAPAPSILTAQTEPPALPAEGESASLPEGDPSGASEWSSSTLDPPANVRATASADGSIEISWDEVSGAYYYAVRWWNAKEHSGLDWQHLTSVWRSPATHGGLTAGETYHYYVCSVNEEQWCANAAKSSAVSATIPQPATATPPATNTPTSTPTNTPVPGATSTSTPAKLTAPIVSAVAYANRVEVSWTEVPGADSYDALWWDASHSKWQTLADDTEERSATHTGVSAGTKYWYTVAAQNDNGAESPWSDYVSVTVPTAVPTNMPIGTATTTATFTPTPTATATTLVLRVRNDLPTANSLSWDGVGGAKSYIVQAGECKKVVAGPDCRVTVDSDWRAWQTLDTPVVANYIHNRNHVTMPLTPGTTYRYRVRARDNNNNQFGTWSNSVSRTVPASTPTPAK